MVNRTKISKEISRRTGGISQKTGKGKTVKQINIWKDEWEQIPGTGTSPYNPPEFRLKEKPDLPIKRQTKKPIGAGPKDVKKAASKRPPRGPRIKTIPVKTKSLGPPSDYKKDTTKPIILEPEKDDYLPAIFDDPMAMSKKGGIIKKKKKKKKKKYSAGGRVSYQGHDGNKLISKYYS